MTRAARILLVDDEPSIQKGLRPLLASRGYDVDSATTGQGALEAFEQAPPDLIVLDLGLKSTPHTLAIWSVNPGSAIGSSRKLPRKIVHTPERFFR